MNLEDEDRASSLTEKSAMSSLEVGSMMSPIPSTNLVAPSLILSSTASYSVARTLTTFISGGSLLPVTFQGRNLYIYISLYIINNLITLINVCIDSMELIFLRG